MRVVATHRGFYVKLRDPGQEFDVPEALFSPKWMKRVAVAEPEETPAPVVEQPEAPLAAEPATAPVVKKRRWRKPREVSE